MRPFISLQTAPASLFSWGSTSSTGPSFSPDNGVLESRKVEGGKEGRWGPKHAAIVAANWLRPSC